MSKPLQLEGSAKGRGLFLLGCTLDLAMEVRDLCGQLSIPEAIANAFSRWSVSQLATLSDIDGEEAKVILGRMLAKDACEDDVQAFWCLVSNAESIVRPCWSCSSARHSSLWAGVAVKRARIDRCSPLLSQPSCSSLGVSAVVVLFKTQAAARRPARWTAQSVHLQASVCADQRQRGEALEREKWLQALTELLSEAALPAVCGVGSEEGNLALKRLAKGRRATTLRKHVRTWRRVAFWVKATFGVSWPSGEQFAAYLYSRAAEPCGRTVPGSCLKTLMFMESAGELSEHLKISNLPAVRNSLEELALELSAKNPQGRKQARQLLTSQVCAMERLVVLGTAPRFVRAFAWLKLVKLWGGLRYSDTEGMPFNGMRLESRGLYARLDRTKTSGAGKRIEVLHMYISTKAWLSEADWLRCGWQLWVELSNEAGISDRDFFLTRPCSGLDGCTSKMARYCHAAAMSQALFQVLEATSSFVVEIGEAANTKLLPMGAGTVWSEHSERATLRTWAASCGVDELASRQMGRWMPSTDESYIRSIRGNVEKAQERIARKIKAGLGGPDFLDENSVLSHVSARLEELGLAEVERDQCLATLKSFDEERDASVDSATDSESCSSASSVALLAHDESARDPHDRSHLGHYFVSVVGHCKRRTLHKGGECHRVPGVHYREFVDCGSEMPTVSDYDHACRDCFPQGTRQLSEDSEDEADSSATSASS